MQIANKYLLGSFLFSSIASTISVAASTEPLKIDVYSNRYNELESSSSTTKVITKEQIEASGAQTLLQVLKSSALIGTLSTVSGNERDSAITMDGFGENSGQNILILVDGQPINSPTLEPVDFGLIPLETVEQIEITPGSASVMFGRSAVAGVIQIKTKRAIYSETTITSSIGSFNQRDLFVSGGKRLSDNSGVRLTVSKETSDNFRDNSATAVSQGKFEFKTRAGRSDIAYAFTRTLTDQELPGYVPLNSPPTSAGTPLDDSTDRLHKHEISISQPLSSSSSLFIGANFRQSKQKAEYISMSWTQLQSTTSRELIADYYRDFSFGRFSAGLQNSGARFNDNYKPGDQSINSVYFNQNVNLSEADSLKVGYRLFDVRDEKDSGESTRSKRGVGSLTYNRMLGQSVTAFAKVEQSARFATIDENGATSGIDFLRPQSGTNYEAGLLYEEGDTSFDVSYFESKLKNEIFYDALSYINENLPESDRKGLRLATAIKPNESIRVGGSILLIEAKRTSGLYKGFDVPYVPTERLAAFANVRLSETFSLYVDSQYTGSQYTLNDHQNSSEKVKSYTLTNAALNWDLDQLKLSLRASNLFDKTYSAYAVTPTATYPGSGRAVNLTLRYTF